MADFVLIVACALALALWWILLPARAVWHDRGLGKLSAIDCASPARWPSISVLVPARNEEETLADAVQSLLEVDYSALEIIIIDDRSSDRTGEVADRLARRDARVRALHVETLPEGWLGKVHALHRGIEVSRGEWLLFTDADIHFAPDVLKRAVAYCLQRQREFLALFPGFAKSGLVTGSTQAAFGVVLLSMLDFTRIADPESPAAMGIGAFNLVKRSFIDRRTGLEWLRMEVADDAGLALMAKRRGARIDMLAAHDLLEVDWYPTLASMLDGVMQRGLMGTNYSLFRYLLLCMLVVFCLAAPVALALAVDNSLAWLCVGAYALPSIVIGAGIRNFEFPRSMLLGLPIGFAVFAYGMLRTFFTCARRGGIYWRGTIYPLGQLRASQRVKLTNFFGS